MTHRKELSRSTPEAQGISSPAILAFVNAVEAQGLGLHSLMLLRHGQVVTEGWWAPYGAEHPHMLFSLSKSFTSTAVGLAINEGRLSLDDLATSFFPGDLPSRMSARWSGVRVRHLLSMSTGHVKDTLERMVRKHHRNWKRYFFSQAPRKAPGTHFLYNNGASYMLSAIVQKVTGMTTLEYLQPRLLEPLGIEGATWELCPGGICCGGWGLAVKTEDILRFGLMYLQKGVFDGKRVLPEAWVDLATSIHVDNSANTTIDWQQGYGFQFWRCRYNAYRGDGAFGQYCIVMPDQDAVLAMTSGTRDMQAILNLVWEHLLPAMGADKLPADTGAVKALKDKLASLAFEPLTGEAKSPFAPDVTGAIYQIEANGANITAITCEFDVEGATLSAQEGGKTRTLSCAHNAWRMGESTWMQGKPNKVAASGAWTAPDTYTIKAIYYETPFTVTTTVKFEGDGIKIEPKINVSFGPTEMPALVGKRKEMIQ